MNRELNCCHRELNCRQDAEALKAIAASKIGQPIAGGRCNTDAGKLDAHHFGDLFSHQLDLLLKMRPLAFDGESDVYDFLPSEGLQSALEIDLRIGDAIFAAKIDRDSAQNWHTAEGSNRIANRVIGDIAI